MTYLWLAQDFLVASTREILGRGYDFLGTLKAQTIWPSQF